MSEVTDKHTHIKILIAEDHELTKIGLIHSLEKSKFIEIVGDADDGKEAIEKTLLLKPDIVLMDLGMPVIDGIEATLQIKKKLPETKVVILTSHKTQNEVLAALTSGANAYCLKDIKASRLIQALECIMDGILWIDSNIANIIVNVINQDTTKIQDDKINLSDKEIAKKITPRELEVLEYLADGLSNKEIAKELCISIYTVKRHISGIIEKLAVLDRTQAAVKALKIGLVKK